MLWNAGGEVIYLSVLSLEYLISRLKTDLKYWPDCSWVFKSWVVLECKHGVHKKWCCLPLKCGAWIEKKQDFAHECLDLIIHFVRLQLWWRRGSCYFIRGSRSFPHVIKHQWMFVWLYALCFFFGFFFLLEHEEWHFGAPWEVFWCGDCDVALAALVVWVSCRWKRTMFTHSYTCKCINTILVRSFCRGW